MEYNAIHHDDVTDKGHKKIITSKLVPKQNLLDSNAICNFILWHIAHDRASNKQPTVILPIQNHSITALPTV